MSEERITKDIRDEVLNYGYRWEDKPYEQPSSSSEFVIRIIREVVQVPSELPFKIDIHFFRRQMVSVAALAIKAIEWCDQKAQEMTK